MIQKYRKNSDINISIAILLMFLGFYLNNTFGWFLLGISLILFIWALCMYAIAKGYKWYIGIVASVFSVLGLLILILLPDKYKQDRSSEEDKILSSEQNNNEKNNNKYPKIPEKYRIEYIGRPPKQEEQKKPINITRIFYNHWKPALCIIISLFILWNIVSNSGFGRREFPQLAEPKAMTFEWEYKNSKYSITETLYGTVYNYYKSNPDKRCWQEEEDQVYLKKFLEEAEEDDTISKIASDIKSEASKKELSNDKLIELTVAFVQSIPYDHDKFELVTHSNKIEDLYLMYPYEVLYNNKGICAGKSFLAASLIKELGYGVALFEYEPIAEDETGHMAPAIKCPQKYSSYNSGYCHIEVTGKGFKIGDIPRDIDAGVAKTRTPINVFKEKNVSDFDRLKDPKIYAISDGDSYQEIINIAQTIQRIETLEKEIDRLDQVTGSLSEECKRLEDSVRYYEQQSDLAYRKHEIVGDSASYGEYVRLYSQFSSAYAKYKSKLSECNREINKYNNLVYEYNVLIEDFYK